MSAKAGEFWAERDEYHDLARQFEQNIEITHPDSVTSCGVDPVVRFVGRSWWASTCVKYYEHCS